MLRREELCECRETDMTRFFYERRKDLELGNDSDNNGLKLAACTAEYRCYNLQRFCVVQRRPPRHLLEACYFWLGIALLVVSVIPAVFHPDVTHVSTVIDGTIGNSISREPIKYL